MSIRLFVVSSGMMIFTWLAVTYLTVVPMDTYPAGPAATEVVGSPAGDPALAKADRAEASPSPQP